MSNLRSRIKVLEESNLSLHESVTTNSRLLAQSIAIISILTKKGIISNVEVQNELDSLTKSINGTNDE